MKEYKNIKDAVADIEILEADVKRLEKDNKKSSEQITALELEISNSNDKIKELEAENDQMRSDNIALTETISEMRKTKSAGEKITFVHEEKTYEVIAAQFKVGDAIVTAEELAKDKKMQAAFVENNVGVIKELKD